MNIVEFHLHNWGAVVTSSYELLRISEQQLDNELILKHTWMHISWKKGRLVNFFKWAIPIVLDTITNGT
jgi:hypothetical protein